MKIVSALIKQSAKCVCLITVVTEKVSALLQHMRFCLITVCLSTVLHTTCFYDRCTHVKNGGNTATAANPAGTSARDAAKEAMLLSKGEPPPPIVPGCGEFPVACPFCWKFKSDIIMTMPIIPIIPAPNAPAA